MKGDTLGMLKKKFEYEIDQIEKENLQGDFYG